RAMRARVPQDVDLEDTLVLGLSPTRFGYLVIAALGALSLWRLDAVAVAARLAGCLLVVGSGAALAWGRWRSRGLDCWAADLAVFLWRNYRLGPGWPRRRRAAPAAVPLAAVNALAGGAGRGPVE